MILPRYKATGQRGQWSARVEGVTYPCVHNFWVNYPVNRHEPMMYDDPGCNPDRPKWRKFIALLQTTQRAVLSQDKVTGKGVAFQRTGYLALYEIENLEFGLGFLRFRFSSTIAELFPRGRS